MRALERHRDPRLEVAARDPDAAQAALLAGGFAPGRQARDDGVTVLELREPRATEAPDEIASLLAAAGAPPMRLAVVHETLEDHFIRLITAADRAVA